MRNALGVLGTEGLDPDVASINCALGRELLFAGHLVEAGAALERSLDAAEALELSAVTYDALYLKAIYMEFIGRFEEARALHEGAASIGERHRVPRPHVAVLNAAVLRITRDMPGAIELCEAAVAAARRRGDRAGESAAISNLMAAELLAGRWQDVERIGNQALEEDAERPDVELVHHQLGLLAGYRGDVAAARASLNRMSSLEHTDDVEARLYFMELDGLIALAQGTFERALESLARTARDGVESQGPSSEGTRIAWPEAVEAALALGRLDEVQELIDLLAEPPRGLVPPLLRAELSRAQALLATARGEQNGVEASFRAAIDGLEQLGYPYWLARARTDLAAWLIEGGRGGEATHLLDDAAAALEELGAGPELVRARRLIAVVAGPDELRATA
jgi:hypothetical protein